MQNKTWYLENKTSKFDFFYSQYVESLTTFLSQIEFFAET